MRTRVFRQCCTVLFAALIVALCMAPESRGQGGEPPYFAIRGAKIVPVSGRTTENSTIIISRGIITAIGADAKIPDEAWIIDGKGLTVYPGLIDSFTDVGLSAPPAAGTPGAPGQRRWPRDLHKRKRSRAVLRIGPALHLGAMPRMK